MPFQETIFNTEQLQFPHFVAWDAIYSGAYWSLHYHYWIEYRRLKDWLHVFATTNHERSLLCQFQQGDVETFLIFLPKSLRWWFICISFSLSTSTRHFLVYLETSAKASSPIRSHILMAISLFSPLILQGISKNISRMSKNISWFYLLTAS